MGLIEKADMNFEVTKKHEKLCNYDLCTSRLYYSVYQRIMGYLSTNKISVDLNDSNSHNDTFYEFIQNGYAKKMKKIGKDPEEVVDAVAIAERNFRSLKKYRKKADYDKDSISRNEYEKAKWCYHTLMGYLV